MIIPTGEHAGAAPSVPSTSRALAEHAKHEAYPEGVEQAHADFAEEAAPAKTPSLTAAEVLVAGLLVRRFM